MDKVHLLGLVQQAKGIVENMLNVYHYAITDLEENEVDFFIISKEKYRVLQLISSLNSLKIFEQTLEKNSLNPVLLVPSIYEDFVIWIKNIEKICLDNMAGIPDDVFAKLYTESYSQIYTKQDEKVPNAEESMERYKSLIDEETDDDDDW